MRSVLPAHATGVHQPQVSLVDQRRGLQGVVGALLAHVSMRQPVQLPVDDRDQLVESRLFSIAPSQEQLRYFVGRGCRHETNLQPAATEELRLEIGWIAIARNYSTCEHLGGPERSGKKFSGSSSFWPSNPALIYIVSPRRRNSRRDLIGGEMRTGSCISTSLSGVFFFI